MAQTTNYNLHLVDDITTERFLDWLDYEAGTGESNMVIIDRVLGSMAQKSAPINVTLLASGWTGVDAPYYQTIAVTGLSATQTAQIGLANGATAEQREVAREAMLEVYQQSEGSITIVADGELPEVDIPATVILFG